MTPIIDSRAVAEAHLSSHPGAHLYFLLDHAGLPGLHRQLRDNCAVWASLFEASREENALSVAPLLVLAAGEGRLRMPRALFDWIGEHASYTSSLVMLSSPLALAPLQARLAARLDARLSENMAAMLRFFDPRVLESLFAILSEEQASRFFSPAEVWRYADRGGHLVSMATTYESDDRFVAPLVVSEAQEFALLDACELDQVISLLRENFPQAMSVHAIPEQSAFVQRLILAAREQGVRSVFKLALYAATVLTRGEGVLATAAWPRFLAELQQTDAQSIERLCDFEFDDEGRQA